MLIRDLLRIPSWLKNGFVVAPLIYSLNLLNKTAIIQAIIAFFIFSLSSSALYILNDIIDRKEDLLHPRKSKRPITSGRIKVPIAIVIMLLLIVLVLIGINYFSNEFKLIVTLFFVNNVLYSYWLKKVNLLDSFSIANSFVLRTIGGCFAIAVEPSPWIIIITFTLSLFLVFIKRKSEIEMLGDEAVKHRKVIKNYSVEILNYFIFITAAITITGYILYSINKEVNELLNTPFLVYSSFFVFLGIFRFIQISFLKSYNNEGDPTYLLIKDRFTQFNILSYFIYLITIIYF